MALEQDRTALVEELGLEAQEARQEAQAILRSKLWRRLGEVMQSRRLQMTNAVATFPLTDFGSIVEREKTLGRQLECDWVFDVVNKVAKNG